MNALHKLPVHTPGPWHVVPYGDGDSLVVCSDEGGEWRICFMATHGGTESVWDAIQANARLIAAAPNTLKALVDLEAYLRNTPHHNAPEAAAARQAIRNATEQSA